MIPTKPTLWKSSPFATICVPTSIFVLFFLKSFKILFRLPFCFIVSKSSLATGYSEKIFCTYSSTFSVPVPKCFMYFPWQSVSYTHLRAHETRHDLVCRLLL